MLILILGLCLFRFTECNIKGEISVLLCPDGLMFDIKSEHCDYPAKVNCSGREQLRKSHLFSYPNWTSHECNPYTALQSRRRRASTARAATASSRSPPTSRARSSGTAEKVSQSRSCPRIYVVASAVLLSRHSRERDTLTFPVLSNARSRLAPGPVWQDNVVGERKVH